MAILNVQSIVKTGVTSTLSPASAGGDSFANTGNEYVEVLNGSGAAVDVTIAAQKACSDYGVANAAHNIVRNVPAGGRIKFGPIDPKVFNDANGRAQITYASVTSVSIGVFGMGRA